MPSEKAMFFWNFPHCFGSLVEFQDNIEISKKTTPVSRLSFHFLCLWIYRSFISNKSFIGSHKKVNIWIQFGYFHFLISFFYWYEVNKKLSIKKDTRFIVQEGILQSWKHDWENFLEKLLEIGLRDHYPSYIYLKVFLKLPTPWILATSKIH